MIDMYIFYALGIGLGLLVVLFGGSLKSITIGVVAFLAWTYKVDKAAFFAQKACDCIASRGRLMDSIATLDSIVSAMPENDARLRALQERQQELRTETMAWDSENSCMREMNELERAYRAELSQEEFDSMGKRVQEMMLQTCPLEIRRLDLF